MKASFKKVPALEKGFAILALLAKSSEPMGVSDIAKVLNYNKSTVYNIVHTLAEQKILENGSENKFRLGIQFYLLARSARLGSEIISTIHSYLEMINTETKLSAFLGTRSGLNAIIVDKVDSAFDIKISSEIGMRLPLLAGAGGKILLSQLPEDELDNILSQNKLKKFTPFTCDEPTEFKNMINTVRAEGVAFDREEYIEGTQALAVPVHINSGTSQFAIWAAGLTTQLKDGAIDQYTGFMKKIAEEIKLRLSDE